MTVDQRIAAGLTARLLDEIPDATIAVARDRLVVHGNRASESISGYSSGEALAPKLAGVVRYHLTAASSPG